MNLIDVDKIDDYLVIQIKKIKEDEKASEDSKEILIEFYQNMRRLILNQTIYHEGSFFMDGFMIGAATVVIVTIVIGLLAH